MPDEWEFESHTYDNRNCTVSSGCQFNEPTTHRNCQLAHFGTIVEGHFDGMPLAALNRAPICEYPGEIAEGNGKRQIAIDQRANDAQRAVLEIILSTRSMANLSTLLSPARSVLRVLIAGKSGAAQQR